MDEQQTLFTTLRLALEDKGLSVYDGNLPPEGTLYPFCYLADTEQDEAMTKRTRGATGTIKQTIHVWHDNARQRGTMSRVAAEVMDTCRDIEDESPYTLRSLSQTILADNTTAVPLMHAVITAEYYY